MANRKRGYIPIYRSIQDHWIWTADDPFDIRSAWIDLIMLANHEDRKLTVGRSVITIHAGQMWTSYVKLARRWHWSRPRVNRYIKMLISDGMMLADGTPNGTLLTLVNYSSFALRGNTDVTTDVTTAITSSVTPGVTPGVTQTITNNNNKSIENGIKEPAAPRGGTEWQ